MDFLQEYLPAYLPQAYTLYKTYNPYITPLLRLFYHTQSYFFRYVYPLIYPLYTLLNTTLQSITSSSGAPDLDLFTLFTLALTLYISVRVLDYMRRTVVQYIILAIKLGMWGVVAAVGVYVYYRGVELSLEDMGWVWGLLQGLEREGEVVGGRRAAGSEREARRMKAPGRGRTRGAGW